MRRFIFIILLALLLAQGCAVWQAAGVPVDKMSTVEKAAFFIGPGH